MNWFESWTAWTKEKINSPLYITFFIAVIVWNWKSFYVLFWLSGDNFSGINQLQYALIVSRRILDSKIFMFDWVLNHVWFFGVPALVTFLVVWFLPKVHNLAHKRYLEFRFERESEFDKQNTQYLKNRQKEIANQLEVVKETGKDAKEISKIENEMPQPSTEDRWRKEYSDRLSVLSSPLKLLPSFIYEYSGVIQGMHARNISVEALAVLDTNGLVHYDGSNKVSLTDKGKFFLGLFLDTAK